MSQNNVWDIWLEDRINFILDIPPNIRNDKLEDELSTLLEKKEEIIDIYYPILEF